MLGPIISENDPTIFLLDGSLRPTNLEKNLKPCYILQAKEFGRKAVVASEGDDDDSLSRSIIEFMKVCDRMPALNV